ncbi:MAG: HAMP domain-containing histidine kinase [Burkholderiales bacterium]|nr:HAMP domain-containing histidine kinase [Burkholderiales bacterium]
MNERPQIQTAMLADERMDDHDEQRRVIRILDQWLSRTCHDLRSSLSGIRSWTAVLERTLPADRAAKTDRAIAGIKGGIEAQVEHIDRMLDQVRILGGSVALSRQPVLARTVVAAAVESARESMTTKDQQLQIDPGADDVIIHGDPRRLEQLVTMLLEFASERSDMGAVVRVRTGMDDDGWLFEVIDHAEPLSSIALFQAFDWLIDDDDRDPTCDRLRSVRLSVIRTLARLHGGSFDVTSGDVGCVFTVRLPLVP